MALAEFIWDHAPKPVQDWMDRRGLTPDSRYEPFKEDPRPWADTQVGPRSAEELRQSGDINLDSTDGMRSLAQALADPDGQKFEAARGNPPGYFDQPTYQEEMAFVQVGERWADGRLHTEPMAEAEAGDGSDLPIGWKQIEADNPAVMTSFETPAQAMTAVRHNDRLHLHSVDLQATLGQSKERDDDLGR